MKVYYAAPLFSEADQRYNSFVAQTIRAVSDQIELYVPQEQTEINDKSKYADSQQIAEVDTLEVMQSDLMVAVLDGLSIDAGVAAEIGIAYAKSIPILGLYTDIRTQGADVPEKLEAMKILAESQFSYVNLYVIGLIKKNGAVVATLEELTKEIRQRVDG